MSVCLCPLAYLKNDMSKFRKILYRLLFIRSCKNLELTTFRHSRTLLYRRSNDTSNLLAQTVLISGHQRLCILGLQGAIQIIGREELRLKV